MGIKQTATVEDFHVEFDGILDGRTVSIPFGDIHTIEEYKDIWPGQSGKRVEKIQCCIHTPHDEFVVGHTKKEVFELMNKNIQKRIEKFNNQDPIVGRGLDAIFNQKGNKDDLN